MNRRITMDTCNTREVTNSLPNLQGYEGWGQRGDLDLRIFEIVVNSTELAWPIYLRNRN